MGHSVSNKGYSPDCHVNPPCHVLLEKRLTKYGERGVTGTQEPLPHPISYTLAYCEPRLQIKKLSGDKLPAVSKNVIMSHDYLFHVFSLNEDVSCLEFSIQMQV